MIDLNLKDAWLNIAVEDKELFNPMDFVFSGDKDKILENIF
jgi:hypothetical protein